VSRSAAALVGAALAVTLLAACSTAAPQQPAQPQPAAASYPDVDVASPQLTALRDRAGIDECPESDAGATPVDDGLPPLALPCLGGGRDVDLARLRGRPLVVNFWATYCIPCREEMPLLQRLHERAGDQLRLVGVDYADPHPAAALELADAAGVTFPLIADPEARLQSPLRIIGLPVTVLVHADGRIAHTHIGPVTSYDQLVDLVREHLGVSV
jgi:thiol-disulfide isomerase/thioredoxin